MPRFITITAVLLFLCCSGSTHALAAGADAIQDGLFDLSAWDVKQQPISRLSGQWKFFPDQLITPEDLPVMAASAVQQAVPAPWNDAIQANSFFTRGHGVGTYWLSLGGASANTVLNLSLYRSCSNAKVFFFPQGQAAAATVTTLGHTATTTAQSVASTNSLLVPLRFNQAGLHHVLIQVSNHNLVVGGLCGEVKIGTPEALNQELIYSKSQAAFLIALVTMTAIYSLAIYWQSRRRAPLWIGLASLMLAGFFFSTCGFLEILFHNKSGWVFEVRSTIVFITISWATAFILLFYHQHFDGYLHPFIARSTLFINTLLTLFFLASPGWLMTSLIPVFFIFWCLQYLAGMWILARALINKKDYAKPMALGATPFFIAVIIDIYNRMIFSDIPTTSLYALTFFALTESQIVGKKFSTALNLAQQLSADLKKEVEYKTARLLKKNKKLEEAHKALQKANKKLKQLSITDSLTRLYNRGYFEQEFYKEWRRCSRQHSPLSILMIDADNFKRVNDMSGHLAGDQCLQSIAQALYQQCKRAGEVVARYGGEEFIVILPDTDQRKALAIAEGVRSVIDQLDIEYNSQHFHITISIGISTTIPANRHTPNDLLEAADAALYEAKNKGRNRVAIIPLLSTGNARSKQQNSYR